MKINPILPSSLILFIVMASVQASAPNAETIKIAAYDSMTYSVKRIETHPGQKLVVVLVNKGTLPKKVMAHNWILLKAGVSADSYAQAALRANDFQPQALAGEVIASIPALGPNESGTASFIVPAVSGTYPYLCTAVGHIMGGTGMRGVLVVK